MSDATTSGSIIVIEGTIRVRDPEAARPAMTAMIAASRAEAGCIDYAYAIDLLDPTLIRVHERWASRAALASHGQTPHLAEWRAHWPRLGISERSLRLYESEPETI